VRIRAVENAAEVASQGGVQLWGMEASATPAKVRGPMHLSTGPAAVAAGVCINLRREDLQTSTHRGHGHALAKGADMAKMMCELYGRATGPLRVRSCGAEPSSGCTNAARPIV